MTAPASATARSARSGAPTAPVRRIRLPKKLRNLELGLLVFACAINGAAVALVELGAIGHLDFTLLYLGAGLSALVVGMHVVMRYTAPDADPFILPIATVLNGIGIAEIYRIDIARNDSGGLYGTWGSMVCTYRKNGLSLSRSSSHCSTSAATYCAGERRPSRM